MCLGWSAHGRVYLIPCNYQSYIFFYFCDIFLCSFMLQYISELCFIRDIVSTAKANVT